MPDIKAEKKRIRREMTGRRKKLPPEFISRLDSERSSSILEFITALFPSDRKPLNIMSYSSYGGEYPTAELNRLITESGNRLILPFTSPDFLITPYIIEDLSRLIISPLGIPEPDPSAETEASPFDLDVIIVPGTAFDRHGGRIGFGKACYDRFTEGFFEKHPVLLIGAAYDFQIADRLPTESHDRKMDYIITDTEIITCGR